MSLQGRIKTMWADEEVDYIVGLYEEHAESRLDKAGYLGQTFWEDLTEDHFTAWQKRRSFKSVRQKVLSTLDARRQEDGKPVRRRAASKHTKLDDSEVLPTFDLMRLAHFIYGFNFEGRAEGKVCFPGGHEEIRQRMAQCGLTMSCDDIEKNLTSGWLRSVQVKGHTLGGLWIVNTLGSRITIQTVGHRGFHSFLTMCKTNRVIERAERQRLKGHKKPSAPKLNADPVSRGMLL